MAKSACADWEGSVEKMLPPINSAAPDWPGKDEAGERRARRWCAEYTAG